MDSGCLKLSENIQFVWSERSYSGDKRGCHACGRTDEQRNVKIELEFWKQNSQFQFFDDHHHPDTTMINSSFIVNNQSKSAAPELLLGGNMF